MTVFLVFTNDDGGLAQIIRLSSPSALAFASILLRILSSPPRSARTGRSTQYDLVVPVRGGGILVLVNVVSSELVEQPRVDVEVEREQPKPVLGEGC